MQSSRWAPSHRRGASTAPSTNAAIMGFKDDTSSTTPSLQDILNNKVQFQSMASSTITTNPPPSQPTEPSRVVETQAQAHGKKEKLSAPSIPTSTINPQAPTFVPSTFSSSQPVFVPLDPYLPPPDFRSGGTPPALQTPEPMQAQPPTTVIVPETQQVLEPATEPVPVVGLPVTDISAAEPPAVESLTVVSPPAEPAAGMAPPPPAGDVSADQFAQTGGETSDLFFGDDFTPIAQPVPQPISQPLPEPIPASPLETSPPEGPKNFQPIQQRPQYPRGERGGKRGRGRGRGEGRGRGGRGGRGRGGKEHNGYQNSQGPALNGTMQKTHENHKPASPPAANGSHSSPAETATPFPDGSPDAPADAPTGPSRPGPAPAVRGDRSATGGVARPKLTEEELSAKLAAVRLRNEEREKAHKAAAEDEAKFREQEERASKEAAQRRKEEARDRREMMQERERNRLRKMKKMGGREWDEGKESAGLLEGTGTSEKWGYGNGFRGRGHYRRGAHGAIVNFGGAQGQRHGRNQSINGVDQQEASESVVEQGTLWDRERGEPNFGRSRGEHAGRTGRGGRGRGRGGRGGRGGHVGGVPSMTAVDFPALGGDKTQAARAAVEEAMKVHHQQTQDPNAGHSPKTNGFNGSNTLTSSTAAPENGAAAGRKGSASDYASVAKPKRHERKFAVDETSKKPSPPPQPIAIASWADQVEEGM